MGMTSQQGHWFVGLPILAIALTLVLYELKVLAGRWPAYLLPAVFVAAGLQAIFDKLMHGSAAPANYGAETAQHIRQGAIAVGVGVVELLRIVGRLKSRWWGLATPIGLTAIGITFVFHAQHGSMAPMLALFIQHRFFGLTLIAAAVVRAFAEVGGPRCAPLKVAFPVVIGVFALLFVFYTEGDSILGGSANQPTEGMGGMTH